LIGLLILWKTLTRALTHVKVLKIIIIYSKLSFLFFKLLISMIEI